MGQCRYQRKSGVIMDSTLGTYRPLSLEERFWSKVAKAEGDACWEWLGKIHDHGYGLFTINKKHARAHRVAWEMTHGQIPVGHIVRHRCDNRSCVRVDHLLLGTHGQNADDATSRKRLPRKLGEQVPSAKLNPEKVRWIRNQHAKGATKAAMARTLGVAPTTIDSVLSGTTWSHV